METVITKDTQAQPNNSDEALAAYNRLLDKIEAVPEATLRTVNVDVPTAITTVLAAYPQYAPFEEAARKLAFFDASCFGQVQDYGLALQEAHGRYLSAFVPPDALAPLVEKATEVRELLLSDAQALAKHGLIEPSRVADIARALGHRGVAFDIRRLLPVFRDNWKAIEGKTAITLEKLEEYGALSNQLLNDIARQQASNAASPAALTRQQTYTLFFNAYDQIRRVVSYLRWTEGDADTFAPSLFVGRGGRGPNPVQPQPAPVAPVPAVPQQEAQTATPVAPKAKVAPGMPGSNPYMGE